MPVDGTGVPMLTLISRADLLAHADRGKALLPPRAVALLEGAAPQSHEACRLTALDDVITALDEWIDRAAANLATEIAEQLPQSPHDPALVPFAQALPLRYYLVKLLRVIAYLDRATSQRSITDLEFIGCRGRDDDYAALVYSWCAARDVPLDIRLVDGPATRPVNCPRDALWRRGLGQLLTRSKVEARAKSALLVGNPHVLSPVCQALLADNFQVAWLTQRFAVKNWFRWRNQGVRQLVCSRRTAHPTTLELPRLAGLSESGVDLIPALCVWLRQQSQEQGPQLTALHDSICGQLSALSPNTIVIADEDATPLPRLSMAAARQRGMPTLVVQHGAPCIRFGFAPLLADACCTWGPSSASQIAAWNVPRDRLFLTGSPRHKFATPARKQSGRLREILLLTTVPPRDQRPDAVHFHLTTSTYADMLEAACSAAARCEGVHRLTVKLHPRDAGGQLVRETLRRYPTLKSRIVRGQSATHWFRRCDLAISCASSTGVEAAQSGIPTIQLLPAGSGDLLPAASWGFFGTARTEAELTLLLAQAARIPHYSHAPDPYVFSSHGEAAAKRVVAVAQQLLNRRRAATEPLSTIPSQPTNSPLQSVGT